MLDTTTKDGDGSFSEVLFTITVINSGRPIAVCDVLAEAHTARKGDTLKK